MDLDHSFIALVPRPPSAAAMALAAEAGAEFESALSPQALAERVAAADLVLVHFWNNRAIYALLRAALPPAGWPSGR